MSTRRFASIMVAAIAVPAFLVVPSPRPAGNLARADDAKVGKGPARLSEADQARLEETGPTVVKQFVAILRNRFDDQTAGELRWFIDPHYLKEHKLQDGKFPIRTVVTNAIYANQVTDDPQTFVVVAQTEAAAKEVFVFRLSVYDGREVYIRPIAPPDPKTRAFSPWILRMKP